MNSTDSNINRIARFLRSRAGQRFFNIAYSLGAAIVIWGTLFKILHLPGGSTLLCVGMGTEVLIFVLTAFEHPDYADERHEPTPAPEYAESQPGAYAAPGVYVQAPAQMDIQAAVGDAGVQGGLAVVAASAAAPGGVLPVEAAEQLEAAASECTAQLEAMGRNLAGLNAMYEMQLRGIAQQLDNLDRMTQGLRDAGEMYARVSADAAGYREQTDRLTSNMENLNKVYENMLSAMTRGAAAPAPAER